MSVRLYIDVRVSTLIVFVLFFIVSREVTDVSVMPCRLNGDVHEGRNEVRAVPDRNPPKALFWCGSQRPPVGREDPVELYCSL